MNIPSSFLSRLDKSYAKQKTLAEKLSALVGEYVLHDGTSASTSKDINAPTVQVSPLKEETPFFGFPSKRATQDLRSAISSYLGTPTAKGIKQTLLETPETVPQFPVETSSSLEETIIQNHDDNLIVVEVKSQDIDVDTIESNDPPEYIVEGATSTPVERVVVLETESHSIPEYDVEEHHSIPVENNDSHRSPSRDSIDSIILSESLEDLIASQESIDNLILNHTDDIDELKRQLHSLKGVIGTVGSKRGLELIHAIESALGEPDSEQFVKDAWLIVYQLIEALKKGTNLPTVAPIKSAEKWMYGDWALVDDAENYSSISNQSGQTPKTEIVKVDNSQPVVSKQESKKQKDASTKHTTEDARILLMSSTLEAWSDQVRIARQSQDATGLTIHSIIERLDEMDEGLRRMGNMFRELEWHADVHLQARIRRHDKVDFDPLEMDRFTRLQELTRQVSEGADDVQEIRQDIMRNLTLMEEWRAKENISLTELDKGMTETRLKPMDSVRSRLERVVKLATDVIGSKVKFDLIDNGVEIDRTLLDKIITPLEHMLRNSVAHGIEQADIRKKNGKTPEGHIRLETNQQAGHIIWVLSDDGQGVNVERVKNKAVEMGIINEDEAITMKDAIELICKPSFSTNTTVSEIAGRGVGMDVVRNHVISMGGRFLMESVQGKGTTTTIVIPASSYSITSLVVNAGMRSYAIPNELISDFWLIKRSEADAIIAKNKISKQGKEYQAKSIFDLLSIEGELSKKARNIYAVLVKDGDDQLVVLVDRMVGLFDLTMSPLGDFWTTAPWIVGSVLLPDGSATFLINPLSLSGLKYDLVKKKNVITETKSKTTKTILVVDDSLTVRKSTNRILKLSGYNVLLAKDGKEGFEMFSSNDLDLVITDVEMPRMDGFELLRSIRQGVKTPDIPVIIITSRTAQRHRNHAETLKASAYLGKPYKDDELLEHIKGLLK